MIICRSCEEHNEDGTAFCVRCGVFLEWEGERVPDPAEPAPTPSPSPSPSAAAEPVAAPAPDLAARQPEQAKKKRLPPRKPPSNVPTGSLICGSCAMPNESSRRFCAKCGHSLAEAKVVRKTPWWRRLLGRERIYEPGTRKRVGTGRRRARTVVRIGVVLALLGGVGVLAGPQRPLVMQGYNRVVDLFADPEIARPTAFSASTSAKGHGPDQAFDGGKNTYWAAPKGRIPFLRATFATPIKLTGLAIHPGVSIRTPEFIAATRPAEIEVSALTPTGPVVKKFPLQDQPGVQTFELSIPDVSTVQVAFPTSRGKHPKFATSVVELELYKARG